MELRELVASGFLRIGDRLSVKGYTDDPDLNYGDFTATVADESGQVVIEKGYLPPRVGFLWGGKPVGLRQATKAYRIKEYWGDSGGIKDPVKMPNMKEYWLYEDYHSTFFSSERCSEFLYHRGKKIEVQGREESPNYKPIKRLFELIEADCSPPIGHCGLCRTTKSGRRYFEYEDPYESFQENAGRELGYFPKQLKLPLYNRDFSYIHVYESIEYDQEEDYVFGREIFVVPNEHFSSIAAVTGKEKIEIKKVLSKILANQISEHGKYSLECGENLTVFSRHPYLKVVTDGSKTDIYDWRKY